MVENKLPVVVLCAFPVPGHTNPLVRIGKHLTSSGFPCFFLTGDPFHEHISAIGIEPHSLPLLVPESFFAARLEEPAGMRRLYYDVKHAFLDVVPKYAELVAALLVKVKGKHPDRKVVIIHDTFFLGAMPFHLGAPLPEGYTQFPKVIGVHTAALTWQSKGAAPFGAAVPPATTEEEQQDIWKLEEKWSDLIFDGTKYANSILKQAGCTEELDGRLLNRILEVPDATLALCSPSLEYPRPDMNPKVQFVGGLPLNSAPKFTGPEWWSEIESNGSLGRHDANRKKIVFVCQGTVALDYPELLHPTIRGLAERDDVIVVVSLGKAGNELGLDLPDGSNSRVVDYLPYEVILPFSDVFVTNAGYGGFMHGVTNGVPMILAGKSEDKAEVSARGHWAGVGVNLDTQTPTAEQVAEGVNQILENDVYRKRIAEIKKENEALDSLARIEQVVREMAK